jgi:prepilin-type N-terminal cleavage/methylation domain-containing protein/prepilin-type processing-associated H-X9-DG protein
MNTSGNSKHPLRVNAFTLVELLAVLAIVGVLAIMVCPFIKSCAIKAQSVAEISGARSAIRAWQAYAGENNGALLPGYLDFSESARSTVRNSRGEALGFPISARYVFRLAPYLDYRIKGSLLVNQQKSLTDDYMASMAPSFGINLTFVGGDFGSGSDLVPSDQAFAAYGKFVVTNINEIFAPSKLIVFASARITGSPTNMEGYNAIKSPYWQSKRWADKFDEKRPYYDYGAVHPRFGGKAACAMADGHVELLKFDDLFDMRRWSNQAAQADDPNWTLQSL